MTPIKVLEQYLSDTYGKITKGAAFDNYYHYTTPKGEILARISKDNIISVYELKHRFGAEEY